MQRHGSSQLSPPQWDVVDARKMHQNEMVLQYLAQQLAVYIGHIEDRKIPQENE